MLLLVMVFTLGVGTGISLAARALGFRMEQGWLGFLNVMSIVLAHRTADMILKSFGLSRSGSMTEVRTRSDFAAAGPASAGDFVEARMPKVMLVSLLIATPLMGLFFLAAPWVLREQSGPVWWLWPAIGIAFLALWIHVLVDAKNPRARVDAEGVRGYPSKWALRRAFVPWSEVYACEIRTYFDPFGKPILLAPTFKGRDGETLMELNLGDTPPAEQARIVKFIGEKLPKLQVDPWEV